MVTQKYNYYESEMAKKDHKPTLLIINEIKEMKGIDMLGTTANPQIDVKRKAHLNGTIRNSWREGDLCTMKD